MHFIKLYLIRLSVKFAANDMLLKMKFRNKCNDF